MAAVQQRFLSIYPVGQSFITLFQISPSTIFWIGFLPPLSGAIIAIATALTVHQSQRAFLPSLSRIINLDFEGIFWQICMYFHFPMRLFEIYVGYYRYGKLLSVNAPYPRLHLVSRLGYAVFGVLELVFLVGLSAVGEKEHGVVHVILFYTFGVFAFLFFVTNTICHSNSLYYLAPYGKISYFSKITLASLYLASVPLIATFYTLYWKGCITFAYELFALTEYIDVFISMAFHGCAFWDIRHKVNVEMRLMRRPIKREIMIMQSVEKTKL